MLLPAFPTPSRANRAESWSSKDVFVQRGVLFRVLAIMVVFRISQ